MVHKIKIKKKIFFFKKSKKKRIQFFFFFFVLFQLQCNNTQHCRLQSGSFCFEEIVQDLRSEQAARNDAAAAAIRHATST